MSLCSSASHCLTGILSTIDTSEVAKGKLQELPKLRLDRLELETVGISDKLWIISIQG